MFSKIADLRNKNIPASTLKKESSFSMIRLNKILRIDKKCILISYIGVKSNKE